MEVVANNNVNDWTNAKALEGHTATIPQNVNDMWGRGGDPAASSCSSFQYRDWGKFIMDVPTFIDVSVLSLGVD